MKEAFPNPPLEASHIQAKATTGFTVTTREGSPARLAIIDEHGNVIESGKVVEQAAWYICWEAQEQFYEGKGHHTVHTKAPGQLIERGAA